MSRTLNDTFDDASGGTLTAVEEFARVHDAGGLPVATRTYRSLVPATPPGPGQQLAFEVDLDACSGCKSCVVACHRLNGLDDGESWRRVGLLHTRAGDVPLQQPVTTACHHCLDPACLKGCPVDAYEKDPVTGIVSHLDDQCIGCGYCTWTCPYEVPVLNVERGIVRKCDMCRGRLAAGEAPACVQSCPNEAIRIRIVDVGEVTAAASVAGARLVPGAPDSSITVPTTSYRATRTELDTLIAADHDALRPRHSHPALALMLVLTQVAAGVVTLAALASRLTIFPRAFTTDASVVGAATAIAGLAVSIGHLGRPRYAFRAVLGLRHSWLSREVLAFGLFGPLAAATAAVRVLDVPGPASPLAVLPLAASAAGIGGVGCSVMIYAVCGRAWWRLRTTARRFAMTTASGGLAVTLPVALIADDHRRAGAIALLAAAAAVTAMLHLAGEATILLRREGRHVDLDRSVRLVKGALVVTTRWRFVLGVAGGVVAPLAALAAADGSAPHAATPTLALAIAVAGALMVVTAELLARTQFFTAEAGAAMPGARA